MPKAKEQNLFERTVTKKERRLKHLTKKKAEIRDRYQYDMGLIDEQIAEVELELKALKQN